MSTGGYPFSFAYRLNDFDTSRIESSPAWRASAARLDLHAGIFSLDHWHFEAPQGLTIRGRVVSGDGTLQANAAGVAALEGASWIDIIRGEIGDTARYTLDADLTGATWQSTGRQAPDVTAEHIRIKAGIPARSGSNTPVDAGQLAVSAATITLSPTLLDGRIMPVLGSKVDALDVAATLHGAIPRGHDLRAVMGQWRDAGGALAVDDFHLVWHDVDVSGNGTLTLDPSMQPQGTFNMALIGYGTILDALVAAGRMKSQDAGYMKIALGLLARAGDPVHHALRAPVTAQNGALYVGPLKLAALPPIQWPQ